jgi:hypothetical protein
MRAERSGDVHVADNIQGDPKEQFVGQLSSKPKLSEYLRAGRTLVPADRLRAI